MTLGDVGDHFNGSLLASSPFSSLAFTTASFKLFLRRFLEFENCVVELTENWATNLNLINFGTNGIGFGANLFKLRPNLEAMIY